jgi:hypothetical protein
MVSIVADQEAVALPEVSASAGLTAMVGVAAAPATADVQPATSNEMTTSAGTLPDCRWVVSPLIISGN